MQSTTGSIACFETPADAARAGYDIQLTKRQAQKLMPLSRKQRREKAKAIKKINRTLEIKKAKRARDLKADLEATMLESPS